MTDKSTTQISLSDISRYRGELMGVAILLVVLFHVGVARQSTFYGLCRMGNVGVDMFLFLSGLGLWFSWTRNPSCKTFFLRRYLRIYPAWFIVACLYYIPRFHGSDLMAWTDLAGDILINWDFWLHDELTFWYIPATMMLYLFAPAYMQLIQRNACYRWLPVMMVMWCVLVQYVDPIHQAVGHIEIFWSRVPIFFFGINMGEAVRRNDTLPRSTIVLLLAFFLMALCSCIYLEQMKHGRFPLFLERMLYIPLTVCGIIMLSQRLGGLPRWAGKALVFCGSVSLEVYLLHAQFVLNHLRQYHLPFWGTALLCLAITLPLAWLLSKATGKATSWIKTK